MWFDPTIFLRTSYLSQVAAAALLRFGCGVTGVTDSSRCPFKRSHLASVCLCVCVCGSVCVGGGGTGVSCGNLTLIDAKVALSSDNLTATSSRAGVKRQDVASDSLFLSALLRSASSHANSIVSDVGVTCPPLPSVRPSYFSSPPLPAWLRAARNKQPQKRGASVVSGPVVRLRNSGWTEGVYTSKLTISGSPNLPSVCGSANPHQRKLLKPSAAHTELPPGEVSLHL